MKIAIIGSGISGLTAAYFLNQNHSVTVFEAESYVGGHTHTVDIHDGETIVPIDTGFIVCNPVNYPNFFNLMQQLNVSLQKSNMSFSVVSAKHGLEYNGTSLNGLFAQRKNLVNYNFINMLYEIYKFNTHAKDFITRNDLNTSLGALVAELKLSKYFSECYLEPMVAAIWSSNQLQALQMPATFVCRFMANHGMLNINDRPQWYTVQNGSREYVKAIINKLSSPVRVNTKVQAVIRNNGKVQIKTNNSQEEFDKLIIATHSDQALKLLAQPTETERIILNNLKYSDNEVVLHTDSKLLPVNKRAWASWNYRLQTNSTKSTVTYNMNMLQNLKTKNTYCISLNQTAEIDSSLIIAKFNYAHPVYDQAAITAQSQYDKISNINNTYYCGAYWGSGFHEDGVNSALRVIKQIDAEKL